MQSFAFIVKNNLSTSTLYTNIPLDMYVGYVICFYVLNYGKFKVVTRRLEAEAVKEK